MQFDQLNRREFISLLGGAAWPDIRARHWAVFARVARQQPRRPQLVRITEK
jgi:hypothetical protein